MVSLMTVGFPRTERDSRVVRDYLAASFAVALVVVAATVPVLAGDRLQDRIYAAAAPIFGEWLPHFGWGTAPTILIAAGAVLWGPDLAHRLSWKSCVAATWIVNLAWTVSLSLVDSSKRGFGDPLADRNEYLYEVPGVHSVTRMLSEFSNRILDFQPDSWTTHVSGHPPGALLTFVLLDRAGFSGGTWAGLFVIATGSTAVIAVLLTIRALGNESWARSAAPFLAVTPLAIWIGTSADGWFLCVAAWGIALLAIAAATNRVVVGLAAGALLGFGVYLNYGLILMGIPALAVLWAARNFRPLVPALIGALMVAAAFTVSGFWWFDGLDLVVDRYYQGIASERPYSYWLWANLAATVCAVGVASIAGLHRARPNGPGLLVLAAVATILVADISALSKAETERIWLSFMVWLVVAAALLPNPRRWLAAQVVGALLINHLLLTNW